MQKLEIENSASQTKKIEHQNSDGVLLRANHQPEKIMNNYKLQTSNKLELSSDLQQNLQTDNSFSNLYYNMSPQYQYFKNIQNNSNTNKSQKQLTFEFNQKPQQIVQQSLVLQKYRINRQFRQESDQRILKKMKIRHKQQFRLDELLSNNTINQTELVDKNYKQHLNIQENSWQHLESDRYIQNQKQFQLQLKQQNKQDLILQKIQEQQKFLKGDTNIHFFPNKTLKKSENLNQNNIPEQQKKLNTKNSYYIGGINQAKDSINIDFSNNNKEQQQQKQNLVNIQNSKQNEEQFQDQQQQTLEIQNYLAQDPNPSAYKHNHRKFVQKEKNINKENSLVKIKGKIFSQINEIKSYFLENLKQSQKFLAIIHAQTKSSIEDFVESMTIFLQFCFSDDQNSIQQFSQIKIDQFVAEKCLKIFITKLKELKYQNEIIELIKLKFTNYYKQYMAPKNLIEEIGGTKRVLILVDLIIGQLVKELNIQVHDLTQLLKLSELACFFLGDNQEQFKFNYQDFIRKFDIKFDHFHLFLVKKCVWKVLNSEVDISKSTKNQILARIERYRSIVITDLDKFYKILKQNFIIDQNIMNTSKSFLYSYDEENYEHFIQNFIDFLFGRISINDFELFLLMNIKVPVNQSFFNYLEQILENQIKPLKSQIPNLFAKEIQKKFQIAKFKLKHRFNIIDFLVGDIDDLIEQLKQKIQGYIFFQQKNADNQQQLSNMQQTDFIALLISFLFPQEEIYSTYDIYFAIQHFKIDENSFLKQVLLIEQILKQNSKNNFKYVDITLKLLIDCCLLYEEQIQTNLETNSSFNSKYSQVSKTEQF